MKQVLTTIGYYLKAIYKPLYMYRMRRTSIGITLILILAVALLRAVPAQANIKEVTDLQMPELVAMTDKLPPVGLMDIPSCKVVPGDDYNEMSCNDTSVTTIDLGDVKLLFDIDLQTENFTPDSSETTIIFTKNVLLIANPSGGVEQYLYTNNNFDFVTNKTAYDRLDNLIFGVEDARSVPMRSAYPIFTLLQELILLIPMSIIAWMFFRNRGIMYKYKEYLNVATFSMILPSILAFAVGYLSPGWISPFFNVGFITVYLFSTFSIMMRGQKETL